MSAATAVTFTTPTRDDLTPASQAVYDGVKAAFGQVPNLYAFMAHSANGLSSYLALQSAQANGTFSPVEQQAVFLAVSQVNGCDYCLAAHTFLAGKAGLSSEEILDLRRGQSNEPRLDAIVKLTVEITKNNGRPSSESLENFFAEGFAEAALIDLTILIADKIVSNYVHNMTGIEIDWPAAPALN
jgi:AhpD family alkylhydroperoxidase